MVLQRYLEQRYPRAPSEERTAFVELLEQNDADILDWLLGRKPAPEHLTDVIRSLSPGR